MFSEFHRKFTLFILPLLKQETKAHIYLYLHHWIHQSCAEANVPCIIISLTHLFVSLGISKSKKVFSAAQRHLLMKVFLSNNLGYDCTRSSAQTRHRFSAGWTPLSGNKNVLHVLSLSFLTLLFKDKTFTQVSPVTLRQANLRIWNHFNHTPIPDFTGCILDYISVDEKQTLGLFTFPGFHHWTYWAFQTVKVAYWSSFQAQ